MTESAASYASASDASYASASASANANANAYADDDSDANVNVRVNGQTNDNKEWPPLRPMSIGARIANWAFYLSNYVIRILFQLIYGKKGQQMPPITDPILLESATSLATKIRKQELTSVEVIESFIKRLEEVNPLLNCVVDMCFDQALKEGKAADELIKSGAYTEKEIAKIKPFLGVPITTKDCMAVKGLLQTSGLYCRRNFRASEDADCVKLMRRAGAIPFAVTNVSEVCMWWESNNTVYGRTNNPYDTNRIVGGSSGGEGCIQAAAASPFGIGSDIGGSIRMPAFFNGIFGHKPTQLVVSNKGQYPMPYSEEQDAFLGVGPMVRHAEDMKPMLKVLAGDKAECLKLDEPVDIHSMKFYYQKSDGGGLFVSRVERDITNAMQRVANYLHEKFRVPVTQVQLPEFRISSDMWFANMKDDSGKGFEYQLGNLQYPVNPYTELLKWMLGLSKHTLIGLITAMLEKAQCKYNSSEYHYMVQMRNKLRHDMQQLLRDNGIFIYPTHPTVAPYHVEPLFRPINFSYTGVINVLGFPATTIPLGQLGSEGLPIGLQVIANFHQDRLCLAVAEELEKAFGGWCRPVTKV